MAWNEPGGGRDDDPWGGKKKDDPWGRGSGKDQGPPDLEESLRKLQNQLTGIFGGKSGSGGSGGGGGLSSQLVAIVAGLAVAAYGIAGFYTLDEQERGVIFRFGAAQDVVQLPGLRWRPIGIDHVTPVNTTRVRSREHQALMLTEDQNIVDVSLTVQYLVTDPVSFVVNVREPEGSLKQATESALRHVVGVSTMDDVIGQGRAAMSQEVQVRLQDYLTFYKTGITVSTVNLDRGAPPPQVQAAFDDVQKAREDEERFINESLAYSEQVIPEARGDAQRILEQANAYRDQVVALSTGEADRFEKLLVEYKLASRVTRDRLYLDAVEDVLTNTSKVLMDVESGNQMIYLPLDRLASGGATPNRGVVSPDMVRDIADAVLREIETRPNAAPARRPR